MRGRQRVAVDLAFRQVVQLPIHPLFFSVERLAITKAGVDDLRELITNDVRFLRQF